MRGDRWFVGVFYLLYISYAGIRMHCVFMNEWSNTTKGKHHGNR